MNREALLHIPESEFCFALDKNTVVIRLRTSKTDVFESVSLIYGTKYDFCTKQNKILLQKQFTDSNYDYYIATLSLSDVRLVYIFELVENGNIYYFSEDGITTTYDYSVAYYNSFQLAYINAIDVQQQVKWLDNSCFYQIFVERFCRGDFKKDDSYINLQWGSIPNSKSFAGGDLQGIINNLDYLASLNINAIYLTPINNSISNHKYDIIDYYAIDKQFGDNETLTNLVNEAHKRNMRIVLDAVFNHCSDHNALFQDVVNKGKASPYFNWFIIDGDEVSEDNYATFGNCKYMPKFNTSNIEVQRYLIDVARYYIAKFDVDGFRLDVSDEVSHDFWREFRRHIKRVKSDCVIIGENWHNAVSYLRGDQYDSIMNYAYTKACLDYFINGVFSAKDMSEKLSALLMRNTNQTNQMMLNLLDSHDTHRFVTQAKSNINKLMSALTLTYMFIGVPCIYYGTENAMEGDYDPDCRRCMDWTKAHTETHLKSLIRTLGSLRQSGLLAGHNITFESVQGLLKVERICSNTKLTYYTNMTKNSIFIKVSDVIESSLYSDNLLQSGGFILSK